MSVEPNQTKELFELMYDIRDRTTRIEAETSRLNIIEKKADRSEAKSNEALIKSNANEKEIEKTQENMRWMWGTAITIVLGLLGLTLKIFI